MFHLMAAAGYRPVIEYCGGTEIGGGYICGSVVHACAPGTFCTPALGSAFLLLDDEGKESSEGEVFLLPPALGLSSRLLNADHHGVYYADTPAGPDGSVLRRHGDRMQRVHANGWQARGRVDDAMNLGGVKVSAQRLEEVCCLVEGVREAAAIAVAPVEGGPERLVVYVVPDRVEAEPTLLSLQAAIREHVNPLFRVADVVAVDSLPRTASNKIMRRRLRESSRQDG